MIQLKYFDVKQQSEFIDGVQKTKSSKLTMLYDDTSKKTYLMNCSLSIKFLIYGDITS